MPKKKKPALQPQNKLLFALGVIFISLFYLYQAHLTVRLSFSAPPIPHPQGATALPDAISIPAIKLNLPIIPTTVDKDHWGIAENGISFLSSSATPGVPGPIILYGHNTSSRFGPIRWLKLEDTITITTIDGQAHIYKVDQLLTVAPAEIQALSATSETLILYTCTGFFDKGRFVVRALPIEPQLP